MIFLGCSIDRARNAALPAEGLYEISVTEACHLSGRVKCTWQDRLTAHYLDWTSVLFLLGKS